MRLKEIQTLLAINTIRNLYFPNDMQRYFDALKEKRVGNCGDRAYTRRI